MALTVARHVARAMERIAPLGLAEKWDNVGLLLEAPHQPQRDAHSILLTVDLTTNVVEEALALPASVIISYHPPIFRPLSSFTLANPIQASLLRCAAAGISVYSPHTSLDSVYGGINDWLASGLGTGKVELIHSEHESGRGGTGRIARLEEKVSMQTLQERIKTHLRLEHLQVALNTVSPEKEIGSIAICAGSGGSMLLDVDADVYFTGEMAHHEVLAAIAAGKNVVLCGHTNTERGYLPTLASKLQDTFASADGQELGFASQLSVSISAKDRHPLDIV
ncbi:NGG1p interacting factor 3 [Auriscalpium vulgare]|uniref:NGG1p interacting factor 3 n=1 Tax=Auriscalpium vulgare TaxID=40419 RepID=A0ACB8S2R8_9AGAM|nr:NGG1p interacting factor 3 [Auriscalpium vulgare]